MAFQASLVSVASQQLRSLLQQVCEDYHLDAAEVLPRYLEAPELPPKKAPAAQKPARKTPAQERPMCAGQVKGEPCKHRAQVGDDLCHIHKKQRDSPKPEKAPKRICRGTTSKGAPCTVKAQDGCDLCHLHMAKANLPPKAPKAPKVTKKSKAPEVEGRGESPPPVFCAPCPPEPQEPQEVEEGLSDEMEDIQQRLAAIMVGASSSTYTSSKEAMEAQGFEEEPEEFDPEQMESPHSQQALAHMKEFDGFMEE
jgi:hypothetical protein